MMCSAIHSFILSEVNYEKISCINPIYSPGGFCVPYISHINGNIAWEYINNRPRLLCRLSSFHLPVTVRIGIASLYNGEPLYGEMEYKDEFGILEDTQLEIRLDYSIDDGATWILLRSKIFRNARQSTIRNYTLGRNLITENLPAGSKILLRLRCGPPGLRPTLARFCWMNILRLLEVY